jgi:hypothetical protein
MTNDFTTEKAEELNNSELLDVHRWSSYPEVNSAVDHIYDEMQSLDDFSGRPTIRKRHIKVIILDLYVKWLTDPEMYIAYQRGNDAYKRGRYNKLHISKVTPLIVNDLISLGYLEHVMGHYGRDGVHTSHYSRMRATDRLRELFTEQSITEKMIEKAHNTECVILRNLDENGRKYDIEYEDDEQTIKWRQDLYAYNNLLRSTHIGILNFPKDGIETRSKTRRIKINKHNKFVRRVFNNGSWEDGGRFYGGWWQGIPSELRDNILINGRSIVEIDYSGLHIVLLYQLEGIDYWSDAKADPYQLDGWEKSERMRDFLKQVLLSAINSPSMMSTTKAVQMEINFNKEDHGWIQEESISIEEIVLLFIDRHAPISQYFSSGHGVKLQNIDSRIAEYVINRLTMEDIPVLCIHDSFIVNLEYQDLLRSLMIEGFREVQQEYSIDPKMKGFREIDINGKSFNLNKKQQQGLSKLMKDHTTYIKEVKETIKSGSNKGYYKEA